MQHHVVCEQSMLIVKFFFSFNHFSWNKQKRARLTRLHKLRAKLNTGSQKFIPWSLFLLFLILRKRGDKLWTKIQQYKLCLHSSDRGQEWRWLHKTRGGYCNLHDMYIILFQDIPGDTPSTTGSVADLRDYTRQSDNQCCGCLIQ